MALTSLESIAEKLQEARHNRLEDILRASGSAAMVKNDYGITVVTKDDIASSLIFKQLSKPKLDEKELLKAIDTEVKELKPEIPEKLTDIVSKDTFDTQVATNTNLNNQVNSLNQTIATLNSQVTASIAKADAEVNNRLSVEQSNDALVNQISTITKTMQDSTAKIEFAVQRSLDESILRGSLQSQNVGYKRQIESLIKQVDSLNSMVEGLQSQLGAVQQQQTITNTITAGVQGAAMATNSDIIFDIALVKMYPYSPKGEIVGSARNDNTLFTWFNRRPNTVNRWESGQYFDITNTSQTEDIDIFTEIVWPNGSVNGKSRQEWFVPSLTNFTINRGQTSRIWFTIHPEGIIFPNNGDSATYNGTYTIKVRRPRSQFGWQTRSKDYPTKMQVLHKSKY